ncbi:STAS domain-containing protein [Kitasatospora cineracea]|uniref:STAS domain-containing protein n=1 Tax=Kitasatospora cineracea TaxID=88074 RepID=UPI003CC56ABC
MLGTGYDHRQVSREAWSAQGPPHARRPDAPSPRRRPMAVAPLPPGRCPVTRPGAPRRLLAALHLRSPDEAVVRLHGDLGPGDVRRLEHRLRHALHRRPRRLVVDLAGVDTVSASAAWALGSVFGRDQGVVLVRSLIQIIAPRRWRPAR